MFVLTLLNFIDYCCFQISHCQDSVVAQNLFHAVRHLVSIVENSNLITKKSCVGMVLAKCVILLYYLEEDTNPTMASVQILQFLDIINCLTHLEECFNKDKYENLRKLIVSALLYSFKDKKEAISLCNQYVQNHSGTETADHYRDIALDLQEEHCHLHQKYCKDSFIDNFRFSVSDMFTEEKHPEFVSSNDKTMNVSPTETVPKAVCKIIFDKIFNNAEFEFHSINESKNVDLGGDLNSDNNAAIYSLFNSDLSFHSNTLNSSIPNFSVVPQLNSKKKYNSSKKNSNQKNQNIDSNSLSNSISEGNIIPQFDENGNIVYSEFLGEEGEKIGANYNRGKPNKPKNPWTKSEINHLIDGVRAIGVGKWTEIEAAIKSKDNNFRRTRVDLKDKWRNMVKRKDSIILEVLDHMKQNGIDSVEELDQSGFFDNSGEGDGELYVRRNRSRKNKKTRLSKEDSRDDVLDMNVDNSEYINYEDNINDIANDEAHNQISYENYNQFNDYNDYRDEYSGKKKLFKQDVPDKLEFAKNEYSFHVDKKIALNEMKVDDENRPQMIA